MKFSSRIISLAVMLALILGIFGSGTVLANENEQRAQFAAPIMIVNTSFLNIRTGPGVEYSILGTFTGGSTFPVLGVASDRVWYQVSTTLGVGWLNSQYAIPRGDFSNVPFVEAPALLQASVPSMSFSGATNNMDDTAVDMGFSNQREWGISIIIDHPLRSGPSINTGEVQLLTADSTVIYSVVGAQFNEGVNWLQISVDGVPGWVEETKVTFRPFACSLSAVRLTQDTELKVGPDGTGGEGVTVAGGQEAYLLDAVNDLYKIELISGAVGWVPTSQLVVRDRNNVNSDYCASGGASATTGGTSTASGNQVPNVAPASVARVVVNTGFLNIRSGPGAQYTSIATVAGGTELPVLGFAPDGVWYLVSGSFGQGWLNSEFTLFRGNGSSLPIIRNVVGEVEAPSGAIIAGSFTVYAAPNLTLGTVGTINGPAEVDVVARTSDGLWVQISIPNVGFGWIQSDFIVLQGNTALIPVIDN